MIFKIWQISIHENKLQFIVLHFLTLFTQTLNSLQQKKAFLSTFLLVPALLLILVFGNIASSVHKIEHESKIFQMSDQSQDGDCFLCSFANSRNQTIFLTPFIFVLSLFYFSFILSKINRVKASYLLSSNFARAPPVIFFK